MLECIQAGRVEASRLKASENAVSLGGSDGLAAGRWCPQSRQVAHSPRVPPECPAIPMGRGALTFQTFM